MKRGRRKMDRRQRGVALVMALLLVLLLSTLAVALMSVTNTEVWSSYNYRLMTQSRYAAEAGAQMGVNYFAYTYTGPTSAQLASYNLTTRPVTDAATAKPIVLGNGISTLTQNYPDATAATNFNNALTNQSLSGVTNATYSVSAKLMELQSVQQFGGTAGYLSKWEITSQGSISGVRSAQVQVVEKLERTSSPVLNYAAFATGSTCSAITFSGSSYTDSYDSSAGTYTGTVQTNTGNVGTNGNVAISGSVDIHGSVSSPNTGTGTCSSGSPDALTGGTICGSPPCVNSLQQIPAVVQCTGSNPSTPAGCTLPFVGPWAGPTNTAQTVNSGSCSNYSSGCTANVSCGGKTGVALAPGTYNGISISSSAITLSAGVYTIDYITASGGSQICLSSAPVIIQVAGNGSPSNAINLSGGSIQNPSGVSANLQFLYEGTGNVTLSGGSGSAGIVYSPNAPITFSGGSAWYGAVVGKTITDSGGSPIHYDRSLSRNLVVLGSFYPASFSWSKY